jgi:competence protein ComEC
MLLALLAVAWLLGIAASSFTQADPAATPAAAGLLGVISFALRPRWATLGLIAAGSIFIAAAGWRYEATVREPSPIARFNDGAPVRLRAMVADEPDEQSTSRLIRLDVRESYSVGAWRPDSGGVVMRVPLFPEHRYGDLLEIRGALEPPPIFEGFDYRDYLFRQGIDSLVTYPDVRLLAENRGSAARAALFDIRSTLNDSISRILPSPEAGLAAGILLGSKSDLPSDLTEDMQSTGTSHLVAVSGQNVVFLAALLMAALAWVIGRRPAAWAALAGILAYAALVGAQPSVVRALIMGVLYVVAIALGRRNTAFVAMGVAAAVMTADDPQIVHDVSFQLSFAATLGLIVLTSPLAAGLERLASRSAAIADFPPTRGIIDIATMTIAATAFTLPIIAINFQRVSLVAPLANLFAVPAFATVAATSALAAITAFVLPGDAGFMSWLAWPPATYMIEVIRLFAGVPLASSEIRGVHVEHAIAYYAALGALIWWLSHRRAEPESIEQPQMLYAAGRRLIPAAALAVVICLASALIWLAASAPDSGRLTVTFLDVGQGDAILIDGPDGHRVLVDGGPSGEAISAALGRRLPFHDRRLDMVVLTHPQQDHLGGLPEVLEQYSVRSVLTNGFDSDSAAFRIWSEALSRHGISPVHGTRGQTIDLGHGAMLSVLSAGPGAYASGVNNSSLVLRLAMRDISFLLTGDITQEGEAALLRTGADLRTTVLKVAHHGSSTSTSTQLLSEARPIVDVISVGAGNPYGHPVKQVLQRLEGDLILRTDENGDVVLSTDGHRLWLETQRHQPAAASAR